jgi:hypothetical protein
MAAGLGWGDMVSGSGVSRRTCRIGRVSVARTPNGSGTKRPSRTDAFVSSKQDYGRLSNICD